MKTQTLASTSGVPVHIKPNNDIFSTHEYTRLANTTHTTTSFQHLGVRNSNASVFYARLLLETRAQALRVRLEDHVGARGKDLVLRNPCGDHGGLLQAFGGLQVFPQRSLVWTNASVSGIGLVYWYTILYADCLLPYCPSLFLTPNNGLRSHRHQHLCSQHQTMACGQLNTNISVLTCTSCLMDRVS